MKIIFLGTGQFAVPILEALMASADFSISLVVTEPAKPAGRTKEMRSSPVAIAAAGFGLDILRPKTLRDKDTQGKIFSTGAELVITVAYGQIIPESVFSWPKYKTVNVHPSLLPDLRGASPIQYALLEGKKETGTSLMLVDKDLDHGNIISQEKLTIAPSDNYDKLEEKLAKLSAELILRDLAGYMSGEIVPQEQNHAKATFSKKIEKEDGKIDWNESAQTIYNKWRAYYRWPGIFTYTKDAKRLNLKEISLANTMLQTKFRAGVLFLKNKNLFIKCKDNSIQIDNIQPEGKNVMSAKEFVNGYRHLLETELN